MMIRTKPLILLLLLLSLHAVLVDALLYLRNTVYE